MEEILELDEKIEIAKKFVINKINELDLSKDQLEKITDRFNKIKFREMYPEEKTMGKDVFISRKVGDTFIEEIAFQKEDEVEISDMIHELFHATSTVLTENGGVKQIKGKKILNRALNEALTVSFTNEFEKQKGYYFITDMVSEMVKGLDRKTLLKDYILGDVENIKNSISKKYGENSLQKVNDVLSNLDSFTESGLDQNGNLLRDRPKCAIGVAMNAITTLSELYVKEKIKAGMRDWKDVYDSYVNDIALDFNLTEYIFHNKDEGTLSKTQIKQKKAEKYDLVDLKEDLKSDLARKIESEVNHRKIQNGLANAVIGDNYLLQSQIKQRKNFKENTL
jgi:hypothetical protein